MRHEQDEPFHEDGHIYTNEECEKMAIVGQPPTMPQIEKEEKPKQGKTPQ